MSLPDLGDAITLEILLRGPVTRGSHSYLPPPGPEAIALFAPKGVVLPAAGDSFLRYHVWMAVYTHLSERALRAHLRPFRVGELVEFKGVAAGTINTIYDVNTTKGHYILRILENRSATDARFEEALLKRLAERGLVVPPVIEMGPRQMLSLFQYLPGREIGVFEVMPQHVAQVGRFLATMHTATRGFRRRRRNRFDQSHLRVILNRCRTLAQGDELQRDVDRLSIELERHDWPRDLPRGIVHGDLFIDNVRFNAGSLCGVLDFEMASTGPYLYDLAVAMDDWAFMHDKFLPERGVALVSGYETKRPLRPVEQAHLYEFCRFAAMRFAITRLYDFEVRRRPDSHRLYKDYRHFLARLTALQNLGGSAFGQLVIDGVRKSKPA
jgi:homoserine kinase type II